MEDAVTAAKLASSAVVTASIVDDAVTSAKLASGLTLGGTTALTTLTATGTATIGGNGSTGGVTVADGSLAIRTGTGSVASIDLYCETNNAHKVTVAAPAHANYSGNVTLTLPNVTGTLVGTNTTGNLTLDVSGDIVLDAGGGDIILKDDGTHWASLYTNGTNTYLQNMISDGDMYFSVSDGGSNVNALIIDGSAAGAATFNSDINMGGDLTGTGDTKFLATGDIGLGPRQGTAANGAVYIGGNTDNPFVSPTAIFTGDGKVGIGTNGPGNYHANGNTLVVAGSGNTGITIATTDDDYGSIFFAKNTTGNGAYRGWIQYGQSAVGDVNYRDKFTFGTAAGTRMTLDAEGRLILGGQAVHASGYSTAGTHSAENSHYAKLWIQGNTYSTAGDGSCLLYTSPSPRDGLLSRMPSSA